MINFDFVDAGGGGAGLGVIVSVLVEVLLGAGADEPFEVMVVGGVMVEA